MTVTQAVAGVGVPTSIPDANQVIRVLVLKNYIPNQEQRSRGAIPVSQGEFSLESGICFTATVAKSTLALYPTRHAPAGKSTGEIALIYSKGTR